jgi:hypothetical protein
MKTPLLPRLFLTCAAVTLAALIAPVLQADDGPTVIKVETIAVPDGQPDAAVREAIVKTAMRRQWIVMSQKEGEVVLKLIHRGCEANLTFRIEGSEIRVFSDCYALNKRGERVASMKVNDGWLKNLRTGIVENLLSAAPGQK